MRGSAGCGDDHLQPAPAGARSELGGGLRCAVRGEHAAFMRNPEAGQRVAGVLHGFPIRPAAMMTATRGCGVDELIAEFTI